MNIKELKLKSKVELIKMMGDCRSHLYNYRINKGNAQLKNVKEVRECRKDIARILTIFREGDINKKL